MGSTKLIRYLNDRFRSTFQGGQVVLTTGIRFASVVLTLLDCVLSITRRQALSPSVRLKVYTSVLVAA